MDRKARIINFRGAHEQPIDGLERIIAEHDEFLDERPPMLFSCLDADDPDLDDDRLIFIDSTYYLVDGDEDGITVVVSDEPLSLAPMLESGLDTSLGRGLPILRDVEILLVGDVAPIRLASELPSLGISLVSGTLALDGKWKRAGYGFSPHFRTEIWKSEERPLTLETTLRAERGDG